MKHPTRIDRFAPVEVGPAGILIAALMGTWLSHNLEYLRVWGARRFVAIALSSIHMYMAPAAAVLVATGAAGVRSTARLARRLEHRLAASHGPASRRPSSVDRAGDSRAGWSFSVPTLVVVVWLLQSGLYLAQENLEATLGHGSPPAFGALTGVHALAPLVHLAVTLGLVTGLFLLRRRITALAARVRAVAAWLQACRCVAGAPPRAAGRSWTPVQRWGAQRWCRPPPVTVGS